MDLAQQQVAPAIQTQQQPQPSPAQPPPTIPQIQQPPSQPTLQIQIAQPISQATSTQATSAPVSVAVTTTPPIAATPTTPSAPAPQQSPQPASPATTATATTTTTISVPTPSAPTALATTNLPASVVITTPPTTVVVTQPITSVQSQQPQVTLSTQQPQQLLQTNPMQTVPKILNPQTQPTIIATTVTASSHLSWPAKAQTSVSGVVPAPTFVSQLPPAPRTVQLTLVNRPQSNLPIVPITATTTSTANIKAEPNKFVCCLLDNGVRCDQFSGNASFSARIQKIIGTKKMNLALDPTVRHAYICDHHKGIITVAKKSTTLNRDTKANARNYNTANSNANALAASANPNLQPYPANNTNLNDLSMRPQTIQHPVNIELLANQNRLANNHAGVINSMPMRHGNQPLPYGHYQSTKHSNQISPMDVVMSTGFDNTGGGDSIASGSSGIDVDLQQLQVNTLRRYKRHFRVQTRPGLNKMQLAESLKTHFRTLPIIEKEAITYFVYIVKCSRNKLDQNSKAD